MKGKQAVLERGAVFDAIVRSPVEVEVGATRTAGAPQAPSGLIVTVPYDDMDPTAKIDDLPLVLELEAGEVSQAQIVSVNGRSISPLPVRLTSGGRGGVVRGAVEFKPLSKHFTRGMNRFVVSTGSARTEVLLEIEF